MAATQTAGATRRAWGKAKVLVDAVAVGGRDVAVVTLNDAGRLNALDVEMGNQFVEAMEHVASNAEAYAAMVLRGAGRAFSAGGDMEFLRARARDAPHNNARVMREFYARFLGIRRVPLPTIAAINGPAIGAGLCVALACDLRVASKQAKLGITFAKLGLHPGMGTTHFLPLAVGAQNAAKLILTGELFTGEEFKAMGGCVDAVDGDGEATVRRALEIAAGIASASPLAVKSSVVSLRLLQDVGLERALQREADAQAQSYASAAVSYTHLTLPTTSRV